MTAFTDEDLKRLKELNITPCTDLPQVTGQLKEYRILTNALLARLEAAEECLNKCGHHSNCSRLPCKCGYEAWRKSKGEVNPPSRTRE
jgi:hypothetical protein